MITDAAYYHLRYEQLIEDARSNLLDFTMFTKPDYVPNWHHAEYAKVLDKFIAGEIKFLMVFMPSQHGKSELCTRQTPAKILGMNPKAHVGIVGCEHSIASDFNRDVQRIIDSDEFKVLYPDCRLSGSQVRTSGTWLRNSDAFEIVGKGGSLRSVGVDGKLIGRKLDYIFVDDPYKNMEAANSSAVRRRLESFWDSVLVQRMHNDSQICLTFTRWREDDIAGRILKLCEAGMLSQDWHVLKFQGIKDEDTEMYHDPRKSGEALWPERHDLNKLNDIRVLNPTTFEAMVQQNPTAKQGNILKRHYFKPYERHELPKGLQRHMYIDSALSEKELENNDPSGILTYIEYKNCIYLVNFVKGRWTISQLIEQIESQAEMHGVGLGGKVTLENKANAKSVKQLMRTQGTKLSVQLENIKYKKLERVENQENVLASERVFAPVNDMWWPDFEAHCLGFPNMKHDEEVDCLTGALRIGLGKKTRRQGYGYAN